ncbi:MAG: BatA domain-containing protein [Candidatus Bipolaricaulota bacterium]|nr:BatA domain-containing protein [Candidatus Bipolaricaulota bacterium]MDW8127090.1 BatA domain-containing protein [Candidatus Bipolaricaulota bacterium]
MSFLLPWAWLWLLALLPVVVLHFLRRKERDWPVSALFLWEGVRPDRPHFLQRLRRRFDLLLLLQMLAVGLFAFSLSQPAFLTTKPSGATLLVLDGSAPLAAQGMAEKVIAEAKRVVAESSGPWAAVLWASPPQVLSGPTSSRPEFLQALARYRPTLTKRPEFSQALALFPEPWPRVVVITDDPQGVVGAQIVQIERPDNLGITAFSVRPTPDGTRYEAFLRILNATSKFQDAQVRVRTEAAEFWTSRLLPPEAEEEVILPLSGVRAQVFTAELLPSDAFPWDNVRYFAFSTREVRVAWQGVGERYLWAALQAAAPVVRTDADADLFVAAYTDLSFEPSGPAFFLAAGSPTCPRGALREAGPLRGAASSLLTHVSLEKFRVPKIYEVRLPSGAEVVIWAGESPLLALWDSPSGRRVIFAADLISSNLPLLPDFPVLVRNLLGWLLPEEPGALAMVGENVRLPEGFQVVLDSETVADVWVPDRPGIFLLRRPKGAGYLAVNVPWEASYPPVPQPSSEPQVSQAQVAVALWPWVLFPLVFLLFGEGLLFYRRGG